jgi:hypothetical protein
MRDTCPSAARSTMAVTRFGAQDADNERPGALIGPLLSQREFASARSFLKLEVDAPPLAIHEPSAVPLTGNAIGDP